MDEVILTTCPRDCYDACGVAVLKRDGVIRHVRGDPDHPVSRGRLCQKCTTAYNGVFLDPAARLLTPLLREGPKGSGSFRRASWEEALMATSERLAEIVSGPGAGTTISSSVTGVPLLLDTTPRTASATVRPSYAATPRRLITPPSRGCGSRTPTPTR